MHTEKLSKEQPTNAERGEGSSLDTLVERGEWDQLKYCEEFQELSPDGQLVFAKKAVQTRTRQIQGFYFEIVRTDTEDAKVILEDLRYLQKMDGTINRVMVLRKKGENAQIPEELRKAA